MLFLHRPALFRDDGAQPVCRRRLPALRGPAASQTLDPPPAHRQNRCPRSCADPRRPGIWLVSGKLMTEISAHHPHGAVFRPGAVVFHLHADHLEFNPPMNWGYPRTWERFKLRRHAAYQALTQQDLKDFPGSFSCICTNLKSIHLAWRPGILWVFIRRLRYTNRVCLATLTVAFLVLSFGMMVS